MPERKDWQLIDTESGIPVCRAEKPADKMVTLKPGKCPQDPGLLIDQISIAGLMLNLRLSPGLALQPGLTSH